METRELIEYIKKVKEEKEKLENSMEQIMKEEKEFKAEADSKKDKNSGFYKDAITKANEKHKEWTEAFNKKENYIEEQNKEIQKNKVQKIKELKEKAQWLDENRNKSAEEIYTEIKELNSSLYAKKQELKYYESTLAKSDVSKDEILKNKKEYISNLYVEIKDKINKAELLKDGKAEQHFNEIQDEIEIINNVNIDNVEEYLAKESKKSENKAQQPQPQPSQPQPSQPQTQPSQSQPQPSQPQPQPSQPQTQPSQPPTQPGQPQLQEDEGVVYNDGANSSKIEKIVIDTENNVAYGYSKINGIDNPHVTKANIDRLATPKYQKKMNDKMKANGIKSPIKRALLRRKINPIIIYLLESGDKDGLIDDYIVALKEKKRFPFDYTINLENSSFSKEELKFMNRIALEEAKIEGNEVIGAKERFPKIKNLFNKIGKKLFNKKEKVEELTSGENDNEKGNNGLKNKYKVSDKEIEDLKQQRKEKMNNAYNNLSNEQKEELLGLDNISKIQSNFGLSYNEAYYLWEYKNSMLQPSNANQQQTQSSDKGNR